MATLHGTINNVFGFTEPLGPLANGTGAQVRGCYVSASFSGTYAQAGNADMLLVGAAIEAAARDGRAVTLLQACFAAPGDEAGTVIGADACTVSGTTISFQLVGSDLATEHANAVLGAMTHDICFYVTFTTTTI